MLVAAREDGLLLYDMSNPAGPQPINRVETAGAMAGVESDGFGTVVTLEGRVGQHVVLRLWSLENLVNGSDDHIAELELSPPLANVGPGDLELEVFAERLDFTIADPPAGQVTVETDASGAWTSLSVSADLLQPHHPVVLQDPISNRILWSERC